MAQKFTFINSSGVSSDVDTATAGAGALLSVYDEDGTTLRFTVNVAGDTVQQKGNDNLPPGTGATDLMVATNSAAVGDVILWDSALLTNTSFDVPLNDRHRLNSDNATQAYERFDLGAGNDILDLSYSAAIVGGLASPGAYSFAVTAWGNAGNDIVVGGAGSDHLFGDGTSGTVAPTAGSDTLFGGAGNDVLFGDNGSTNVDESVGAGDTLFDGTGSDTLFGEGGNDSMHGDSGLDTFFGGGGNDTIDSGEGDDDWTYGGAGNDLLTGADTAYGGDGNDTIDGGVSVGTGIDVLYGDAGSDTLLGQNSNDTLYGGAGDDRVLGGAGDDTLYGGDVSSVFDSLNGGTGNDIIFVQNNLTVGSDTTVTGWDGEATIDVTAPAGSHFELDLIDGGTDNPGDPDNTDAIIGVTDIIDMTNMGTDGPRNVLTLNLFANSVIAITGIEAIVATATADIVDLTYNNGNTHIAYNGDILVNGLGGSDVVFSGAGADTIIGDNVTASIGATPGNDTLFGGDGNDTLFGDYATSGGLQDTLGGNDTLFGGSGDDTLFGGAGNDTLGDAHDANAFGGAGSDILGLHFGDTNTQLFLVDGGAENDLTDGNDHIVISGAYQTIQSSLGGGDDVYVAALNDAGPDEGGAVPHLTDIVFGGAGNDVIAGYFGDDSLFGGAGNDVLWGGSVRAEGNFIYGGDQTDVLYAGDSGLNFMYGGNGTDYYYWGAYQAGSGDQIYDLARTGAAPDGTTNYLVVFGAFDSNDVAVGDQTMPDFLANGFGAYQASQDLRNPATINIPPTPDNPDGGTYTDNFELDRNNDGTWTLHSFYNGADITFDQHDITTIALWNNDAVDPNDPNQAFYGAGSPVLTYYSWNGSTYAYTTHPL